MLQVPQSFYPNYGQHGEKEVGYEFMFNASVTCENKIAYLSVPNGCEPTILDDGKKMSFQTDQRSKVMSIYFKTYEMLSPQINYAESAKYPDMKAV